MARARLRARFTTRLERFVLGTMMTAVAYLLERRLRKSLPAQGRNPRGESRTRESP
jgi:hypothetical protein